MNLSLEQARELLGILDGVKKWWCESKLHDEIRDIVTDEISFLEREEESRREADGWKTESFEGDGQLYWQDVRRGEDGEIIERRIHWR